MGVSDLQWVTWFEHMVWPAESVEHHGTGVASDCILSSLVQCGDLFQDGLHSHGALSLLSEVLLVSLVVGGVREYFAWSW